MTKKKIFFKYFLFVTIFILLFIPMNTLFLLKTYPVPTNLNAEFTPHMFTNKIDGFYELPKNSLDVIFLGNSHVHCDINPLVLWQEYGMTSYDLSADAQDLETSYYYLVEGLKTQKPKAIVLEINKSSEYQERVDLHCTFDFMKPSLDKYNGIINRSSKENQFAMLFPISDFHSRWKELGSLDFNYFYWPKEHRFYGYFAYIHTTPGEKVPNENITEKRDFTEYEQRYLDMITRYCADNEVKLITIVAPILNGNEYQSFNNTLKDYFGNQTIEFINYNFRDEEIGLDYATDFADDVHMNILGAEKFTKFLGKDLSKLITIEDKRGNQDFQRWNENLRYYNHLVANYELTQIDDYDQYMKKILNTEDYVAYIVGQCDGETPFSYRNSTGEDRRDRSYIAVIDSGEYLYEGSGEHSLYYQTALGDHVIEMGSDTGTYGTGISFDYDSVIQPAFGINIAVYDKMLEKFISTKTF